MPIIEGFPMNWVVETGVMNSDTVMTTIKMDEMLECRTSKFQEILMFKNNKKFGRCLVLDNAIQCTELDECSYQEMISFLPLNIHPNPKRVLIIGGGDGGVAREVTKHPLVEEIVMCEIDGEVVELSKKYLPFMAAGFESPKLKLIIGDGFKYVHEHQNEFDVIITDSSDPMGPAVSLFQMPYYRALHNCLREDGIIACQAESYWYDLEFIKGLFREVTPIFASVAYATTAVPSYPSGQIGFLLASKQAGLNMEEPRHCFTEEECEAMKLKFYSAKIHRCAFTLPRFVQKELDAVIKESSAK